MIKIGLIGEDPYDTQAISHLMKQKFDKGFHYVQLSKLKTGTQIFNETAVRSYNFKIRKESPHYIIVLMDADAIITEENQIRKKKTIYENLTRKLNCKCLLLLNIYELEALILADIDSFNKQYKTSIHYRKNVMHQEKPKEFLRYSTLKGHKQYSASDCPDLFKLLNFDTIKNNCAYFKTFISNFEKAIKN